HLPLLVVQILFKLRDHLFDAAAFPSGFDFLDRQLAIPDAGEVPFNALILCVGFNMIFAEGFNVASSFAGAAREEAVANGVWVASVVTDDGIRLEELAIQFDGQFDRIAPNLYVYERELAFGVVDSSRENRFSPHSLVSSTVTVP